MEKVLAEHIVHMLMEISIQVGNMLRVIEEEGRNPLWVAGPEAMKQFGLSTKSLQTFEED